MSDYHDHVCPECLGYWSHADHHCPVPAGEELPDPQCLVTLEDEWADEPIDWTEELDEEEPPHED
jgi:hypothetical protein